MRLPVVEGISKLAPFGGGTSHHPGKCNLCKVSKFCHYNNYSLTQPRYFCKGCRRYWTKGGSLRNIPVGGGCRKNRRGKSLTMSTDGASATFTGHLGNSHSSIFSGSPPDIDLALVYANLLSPPPAGSFSGGRFEPQEPVSSSKGAPPTLQHLCVASGMADGTDAGIELLVEADNGSFFGWEALSDPFLRPSGHC
ncbi:hypothetical protein SAY87_030039 [Trapa incisa]|uniref:Dof zinc finger protein n=1 Tax=Trapa incisa TaxID=236973 RepID=A0AAN7QDX2_9MYRT|nr:hypothetical protein SAY87_030039 [Trapa incisa]